MLGVKVQKQVAGVAISGFDDCLAQTANDHPVTCRLPFAVSLETKYVHTGELVFGLTTMPSALPSPLISS